jgi:hypothetical protein
MEKQKYFALVDLKKEYIEAREEENKRWNDHICWYGTPEEQEEHMSKVKDFSANIEEIDTTLAEARKGISKETLRAWSKEYYGK